MIEDKEAFFKYIIRFHSYDSETNSFIHEFIDKMEKERRLNEVSVKFFKVALSNFDYKSLVLLVKAYYYPNTLNKNEYYDAVKLLALFFSYDSEYPFDNTRLNIIKLFINEGVSFLDKENRFLFVYDLHLLLKNDDDLAYYMSLIDYNILDDFIKTNDISFRTIGDKEVFNNKCFKNKLNFIKKKIKNCNKRLIKWKGMQK